MTYQVPPPQYWTPGLRVFVARLRATPVRGTVTSWWRSQRQNEAVGGAASSWHLVGRAVDFVPAGSWSAAAAAIRARGVRVLDEGDHLHLSG